MVESSPADSPSGAEDQAHAVDGPSEEEREDNKQLAIKLAIRGANRIVQHNYELALADFESAARVYPDCPKTDYGRGLSLQGLGRTLEALSAFREATRREPEFAMAHYCLGRMLFENGDLDAAECIYSEALKIDPRDAQVYSARARVWFEKHEYERAVADLNEAIRLEPKVAERFVARAHIKSHLGQYDEARKDSDAAVERAPGNVMIRIDRAILIIGNAIRRAAADEPLSKREPN
jgi:tetratricopeptide (TPR) repeat protein